MALKAGTRLGPYEIVALLGAGGMGEVYRARDTRLDRTVAIKVLLGNLSFDPQRRDRFQREAKTISGLSHPNICALYDVGEQEGTHYLVLEYLEGQSLADKLRKGPLPIAEALKIGAELAGGLGAAHRRGIVHRDLKPANVMLTNSGAKLLDFGLAKPAHSVTASAPGDAPTIPKALTEEGVILGTFQYMAPEQIEGKEADPRSDIFALGLVLYEMVTGQEAFHGSSRASLIGAIMHAEPAPISQLQPVAPLALEHLVQSCLAKDPEQRIQSAHDVLVELKWIASTESKTGASTWMPARKKHLPIAWSVAAILGVAIGFLVGWLWLRKPPQAPALRAVYPPPVGHTFAMQDSDNPGAAVSPDGSRIAFECGDETFGNRSLWLFDLSTGSSQALPGTENGKNPFWSPDSRSVGFIQAGKLRRMDLDGKVLTTIVEIPGDALFINAIWSPKGIILVAANNKIFAVPSAGGELATVLNDTASQLDVVGQFLPDGHRFFAYRSVQGRTGLYVLDLKSAEQKFLPLGPDTRWVYLVPGYLLFHRGGALLAQRFDARSLELAGEPSTVSPNIYAGPDFTASGNGVLQFFTGGDLSWKMGWWSRDGKWIAAVPLPADTSPDPGTSTPRLSPDGTSAAVSLVGAERTEEWVLNLSRGTWTRLTFGENYAFHSTWSPDSRQVAFCLTSDGSNWDLAAKSVSGLGEQKILLARPSLHTPTDWSRDGRYLIYDELYTSQKYHVGYLDFTSGKTRTLFNTQFDAYNGRISPDGHWLAYVSNESGQYEVYAVSFPEPTVRALISTRGGYQPAWSRDGRELYYVAPDKTLMSVPISASGSEMRAGTPVALFKTGLTCLSSCLTSFDVSPDGKRFLMVTADQQKPPEMTVISNWTALLKK